MSLIGSDSEERFVSSSLGYRNGRCASCRYAPNAEAPYQPFLDEVGIVLQKVKFAESIVLPGGFNAHMDTDYNTWKDVIGRQGDVDINRSRRCLP